MNTEFSSSEIVILLPSGSIKSLILELVGRSEELETSETYLRVKIKTETIKAIVDTCIAGIAIIDEI